jgi:hypothetical protein
MARRLLLATVCIRLLFCLSPQGLVGQDTANSALPENDGKAAQVDYLKQIKPLLRQRCFSCHGSLIQKANLRLDTVVAMLKGGDSGPVVNRGMPSKSEILDRVSTQDIAHRMPPEHEGEPLNAAQIGLIKSWIEQGANGPANEQPDSDPKDHWSFQLIARPEVPAVRNQHWVRNPIDAFLARQHERLGLKPQAEAARTILLRRLYFDLIGVPPTHQEIAAFEKDNSPEWYQRTVDRLLNDARHGERWGRHWMDVWRYSDWWGLGQQLRNSQKHIWHWRDWIVESLNDDTSYAEMVRLMLAADELHPNDLDKLRATGFLARNYFLFNRNQWMEETVEHVGKGFLGLTFNCAKCHDHKYDPIAHADHYRMRAFFEPYHVRMDMVKDQSDLALDGIPRVFDGKLDAKTYRYIRGQEKNPDKSTLITPGVPDLLAFKELSIQPVTLPPESWQPERRPWVQEAYLKQAQKLIQAAELQESKATLKLEASKKHLAKILAMDEFKIAALDPDQKLRTPGVSPVAPVKPQTPELARANVASAQAGLAVAQAAVVLANAEKTSLERRIAAMHVEWAAADEQAEPKNKRLATTVRETTVIAVQAERNALVEKAWHAVAVAHLAALQVATDKRQAAQKTLKTSGDALTKAITVAKTEVKPTDKYSRLIGAKWTPTRFFSSGKDDPMVTFAAQSTGRRTALADWITDRRNPLTARVAANHIWLRHMGEPLVATVFDFGRNGADPSHPELLDWLAAELIENDWSMKHLHRLIVSSTAYRMSSSSAGQEANSKIDRDNQYYWKRSAMRLESQAVRDSILALSGTLDATMGGPPVLLAQQATSTRRSLYFFHSNNSRNLFLTTFDEALVKDCYRREKSIVPQQALALVNSKLVLDASKQIAERLSVGIADDAAFVEKAFVVLLGIRPNDSETKSSMQAIRAWKTLPKSSAMIARSNFVWTLMNHNDFVTVR